jgi:hypothetical protein
MRTRRQFQPTVEYMPLRMVPSAVVVSVPDPTDPTTDPSSPQPPVMVNPTDPTQTPPVDPGNPAPIVGPGSYTNPSVDPTQVC